MKHSVNKQKEINVREMVISLRKKLMKMEDSELKMKLSSIFSFVISPNADLDKILRILDKLRNNANISSKKMDHIDTRVLIKFWDDIIKIITNTIKKNKELDRTY
ncbi:MAG: hypothetical protein ACOC33_02100 [bacterium]